MTEQDKNKVYTGITDWMAADDSHSLNELKRLSGVSPIMLMAMKDSQDEYKPNTTEDRTLPIKDLYFHKVATAIGISLERLVHFESENFKKVVERLMYAQARKRRVLLDSRDSGAGKTYTLEHYARHNKDVLYIKATSLMTGNDLINELITALKIKVERASKATKLKLITEKFVRPGFLIILDEFESVKPDMYRVLKDIEDATKGKCGMVLVGKGIIDEIRDQVDRGKKLMAQIWRRFRGNKLILRGFQSKDVQAACREHGIEDQAVIGLLSRVLEDFAMLNEAIYDMHEHLISQGEQVSVENVKDLFELDSY